MNHKIAINTYIAEMHRVASTYSRSNRSKLAGAMLRDEQTEARQTLVTACIVMGDTRNDANKAADAAHVLYGLGLKVA